mgnify:FL=1
MPASSQPTYEELKLVLYTWFRARNTRSQPTYEELKPHFLGHISFGSVWFSAYL